MMEQDGLGRHRQDRGTKTILAVVTEDDVHQSIHLFSTDPLDLLRCLTYQFHAQNQVPNQPSPIGVTKGRAGKIELLDFG